MKHPQTSSLSPRKAHPSAQKMPPKPSTSQAAQKDQSFAKLLEQKRFPSAAIQERPAPALSRPSDPQSPPPEFEAALSERPKQELVALESTQRQEEEEAHAEELEQDKLDQELVIQERDRQDDQQEHEEKEQGCQVVAAGGEAEAKLEQVGLKEAEATGQAGRGRRGADGGSENRDQGVRGAGPEGQAGVSCWMWRCQARGRPGCGSDERGRERSAYGFGRKTRRLAGSCAVTRRCSLRGWGRQTFTLNRWKS